MSKVMKRRLIITGVIAAVVVALLMFVGFKDAQALNEDLKLIDHAMTNLEKPWTKLLLTVGVVGGIGFLFTGIIKQNKY